MAGGALPPGARVPPEDGLIERYGVSRTTIRTAIQSLVARGLIEIRRGKGTFVTQPVITQELTELTGLSMICRRSDATRRRQFWTAASWLPVKPLLVSSPCSGHRCRADSARTLGRWRTAVLR